MLISGPSSVSGVNTVRQQELDLHPFQRVTAQVLSVTGTTAMLSIEGHPIVAQLASTDQAVSLLPQQTAQFIVTQRIGQKITLKVINQDQDQAALVRSAAQGPEIAIRLLEQHNIPVTANHLIIARAMLKKHLPVTPALLNELQETLSTYGAWGSNEAELAAALKSDGLPVNAESLGLLSRQTVPVGASLSRLIARLSDLTGKEIPPELSGQLDSNLSLLNKIVLQQGGDPSQLAEQLKMATQLMGTSLESIILEGIKNPEALLENNLLSLVRLQQALERAGKQELAETISAFLQDIQQNQFLSLKPESIPGVEAWSEIAFAIRSTPPDQEQRLSSARLRIARDPKDGSNKIDPAYTRLILQIDIRPGQIVEVDLSVVDKQIRTQVTAPDETWRQEAEEEWHSLEQALQSLGFTLKDMQIEVGELHPFERFSTSNRAPIMSVNIEA